MKIQYSSLDQQAAMPSCPVLGAVERRAVRDGKRRPETTMTIPDRTAFESAYAGQAPWDMGRPQKAIIDVADQITGSILDAGCGTGEEEL